jgi:hypothetical protein
MMGAKRRQARLQPSTHKQAIQPKPGLPRWLWLIPVVLVLGVVGYLAWSQLTQSVAAKADTGQLPASMGPSWKELDDPAKDGWDTEVVSSKADKVLQQLYKMLTSGKAIVASELEALVSPTIMCVQLLPTQRKTSFQDAIIQVERSSATALTDAPSSHHGVSGFAEALQQLASLVQGASDIHAKFKLFRITPTGEDTFRTVQFVALSGHLESGMVEQNATWEMNWIHPKKDEAPRIQEIKVTDFELVRTQKPVKEGLFADNTLSVLGKTPLFREQFHRGMNHWFEMSQDRRYYYLMSMPGLAVGDVNGDGLEDLYVSQDEGLPNRLYLQQADGSALEVAEAWGVNWLHRSRGVLLVDLDHDGKQDLVVAMTGHVIVCQNLGNKFEVRTMVPTDDDNTSLSAVDYNNDGKLDLYVCAYQKKGIFGKRPELLGGGPNLVDANRGGSNRLLRNDMSSGKWAFTDVTKEAGLEYSRYGFSACWEDYDGDGWIDVYVANDFGWSQLFKNTGGKFTEVSGPAGTVDKGFSMSASWADYDQDGLMDVYVGNMFSGAGGRITFQTKYLRDKPELRSLTQRMTRGNTLFKNAGKGKFTDVTEQANVTMGRWAWSSPFIDINSDGLEDIVVTNGYITTEDTGDL